MLSSFFDFIIWIFVPVIYLIALYILITNISETELRGQRRLKKAGLAAGVVFFIIVTVYQTSFFLESGFPKYSLYHGFSVWWTIVGAMASFLGFTIGRRLMDGYSAGLVVLTFSFVCIYVFVHYLFIRTYNDIILPATLGATFGALLHFSISSHPRRVERTEGSGH